VYACQGDYQKAYDYHQADLKKRHQPEDNALNEVIYLYQLGKLDEALDMANKSIDKTARGAYYFLRAAIEYDRGQYGQALQDADAADRNSWDGGSFIAYFEGLEAVRHGQRDVAVNKLQFAEATLNWNFDFAIQRSRAELEKLGAPTVAVTPSVHLSATPMPPK